jgi:crotonobetainyl-CoA:carnitine CoA-transferase CaiB-like acyl-CoA transferase
MTSDALRDVMVVDLSDSVGGAYCAKLLADLGADVVKVEPPSGDPLRRRGPYVGGEAHPERSIPFLYLNRRKRLQPLDLTDKRGRQALQALTARADVVVESDAAGELESVGAGYEAVRQLNPRMVWASVTHFGTSGPYRHWKGTDLIDWAMGGYLYFGGDPDRPPIAVPGPQGEYHAGFLAAGAALAALRHARAAGVGQRVETSAFEALLSAHGWLSASWTHEGQVMRRQGATLTRCRDGWVCIFRWLQSRAELLLMTAPELVDDPRFATPAAWRAHESDFRAIIEGWCADHTWDEVVRAGQELRLPITPVRDAAMLLASEQLAARDWWVREQVPGIGEVVFPGMAWKMTGEALTPRPPLPPARERGRPDEPRHDSTPLPRGAGEGAPLAGIRVLELTFNWAGPLAGRHLGDLGADVIKIEVARKPATRFSRFPGGVPGQRWWNRSAYFNKLNRNKRGICLDIATERGRELFLRLVAQSDVVLENNSARVLPNLGIGYEVLRAVNPGIILCSISGFGQTGPERDFAAYGINIEASCGLAAITGYSPDEPRGTGSFYADPVGAGHAAVAILAALHQRDHTARGQMIDLALNEAAAALFAEPIMDAAMNGVVRRPTANRDPRWFQGVYPTEGQDQWLAIAVRDDDEWAAFCRVAGQEFDRAEWRQAALRLADQDTLDAAIAGWTAGWDHYALAHALQDAGVPAAPVLANFEILADPHVNERGFYLRWYQPDAGWQTFPGMPWRLSATAPMVCRHAPSFGEHNRDVFRDLLGLDEAEIADLYAAGITADEPADTELPPVFATLTPP